NELSVTSAQKELAGQVPDAPVPKVSTTLFESVTSSTVCVPAVKPHCVGSLLPVTPSEHRLASMSACGDRLDAPVREMGTRWMVARLALGWRWRMYSRNA